MQPPTPAAVKAEALRLGFVACGITTLEPVPHAAALERWLRAGFGGDMRYLNRQAKKRKHPSLVDPDAGRAVVVLDNYYYEDRPAPDEPGAAEPPECPRIARYARGQDYHQVTLGRLEELAAFLRRNGAGAARVYVDTGPIPERELAQRAGLGWIGKNTMLIRPGLGSWFFIGTVLTDLQLPPDSPVELDHCGSCNRCLEAFPTGAFVEPRALDARRCISYLTIEQKGPIPPEIVPRLGGWAFGCDICNEVCPWNHRFAQPSAVEQFGPREVPGREQPDLFEAMNAAEFDRRFGDTPLARPGLERMRRNWAAAWASLDASRET
jgi:epoxyqueuosine reductase